jgi:uncharacterized membrane protein
VLGIILEWTSKFLLFLVTYIISSRIISVPVALALHFPHYIVFIMVFTLDMIQIPLFLHIFKKGTPKIWFIQKLFSYLPSEEKVQNSKIGKIALHFGGVGIAFISSVPTFGGGMWSAILFAHILRLSKKQTYIYLAFGAFIGCLAVVYGFHALFIIINYVVQLVRATLP